MKKRLLSLLLALVMVLLLVPVMSAETTGPYQVEVFDWYDRTRRWGPYTMQPMEGYDGLYYAEIEIEVGMEAVGIEYINSAGGVAPTDRVINGPGAEIRHTLVVWDVMNDNATASNVSYPDIHMGEVAAYLEMETATPDYGKEVVLKKKEGFPEDARIVVTATDGDLQSSVAVTEKDDQHIAFTCMDLEYTMLNRENLTFGNVRNYHLSIEYKANLKITGKGEVVMPEYARYDFTVAATPDEGYELESITVTDKSGNPADCVEINGNEHTYIMPVGGAEVAVVFKEISTGAPGAGGQPEPAPIPPVKVYPVAGEPQEEKPAVQQPYTVLCRKLNVRAGAGTEYAKIGSLTRGQAVNGRDLGNGWIEIVYEGKVAYVSAQYASLRDADCAQTVTVLCRRLNVRAGAGVDHEKLGSVERGDVLCVLDRADGWVRVRFGGVEAWVCAKYVA